MSMVYERSPFSNPSFRLHCYSYAPVALSSYELITTLYSRRRRRLDKKAKSKAKEVSKKIPGATRSRFTAHVGSHSMSNEMFITKSFIEDHMLGSYRHAFDQLRATNRQP
ncbi:hypothetical protein BJV82DRAFT_309553 [Fennellomyces sp. T-0311]|nr:hypothetical protein BJV82DRAFT_309553 [Fennellomyces sp. T-0311]